MDVFLRANDSGRAKQDGQNGEREEFLHGSILKEAGAASRASETVAPACTGFDKGCAV